MTALAPAYWCQHCCFEWSDAYCDFCGKSLRASLVPVNDSGPEPHSEGARGRANQEDK